MSRICVKNLPKYVAEDRLREFFSAKGEVTDAKLMRTKDGKSRQFAFIGFRTPEEAKEAIKYFNKSYLDTFRINCEIARKVGDPEMPRPWSRHSLKQVKDGEKDSGTGGSKGVKDEKKKSNIKKGNDEENDDPGLQEFLQVVQPRGKSKLWADDTVVAPPTGGNVQIGEKGVKQKEEGDEKVLSENVENDDNDGGEDEKVNDVARNGVASYEDYFKSRVKTDWTDSENESSENDDDDDDNDDNDGNEEDDKGSLHKESLQGVGLVQPAAKEEVHPEDSNGEIVDPENLPSSDSKDSKDEILDTARLFIRNLPYTATEDELEEHFGKFGKVSQVHLVIDKDTKRSKGFAYVHYELPESASRALEELDNTTFQGRLLHVMLAKQKNPSNKQETNLPPGHGPKTFKQRREEERKAAEASGDTRAWNSLFMRPDTIVENIARRHGVSKSDLLDREANDLAVRIALGETQVIADTKKALSNAGVNVTSLEDIAAGKADGIKRSNCILLVKNLPYGSSEGQLADMFGRFGTLDKIILPPTKTLALIAFLEPSEARAAFKGLAYKRYKDAPLYLEWAPANVLSQSSTSNSEDKKSAAVGEHEVTRAILEQSVAGISEADLDPDRIESRSLFVKNLNFKTPDESLKKHFVEHMKEGEVLSVRIKKHVKHGKNVSMGFGFLEFDTLETATNVCRELQGTVLDGHALILQLCHGKKDEQAVKKVDKDRSSTKLLVRNVAFEATEKDLRQLFSPFGQIKSLRLPMKFGNHRGFAFVEFLSKQEAQNALQALSNTHLYGRHLVLERAKEGESLEELRARTAAQFTDEQSGYQNPTKLSKKRKNMAILDEESMKFQRFAD